MHGPDNRPGARVSVRAAKRVVCAQICDFGLSRILDADNNSHVSATSHGTASWMPPVRFYLVVCLLPA